MASGSAVEHKQVLQSSSDLSLLSFSAEQNKTEQNSLHSPPLTDTDIVTAHFQIFPFLSAQD